MNIKPLDMVAITQCGNYVAEQDEFQSLEARERAFKSKVTRKDIFHNTEKDDGLMWLQLTNDSRL